MKLILMNVTRTRANQTNLANAETWLETINAYAEKGKVFYIKFEYGGRRLLIWVITF